MSMGEDKRKKVEDVEILRYYFLVSSSVRKGY